jgi:hypothetical protein
MQILFRIARSSFCSFETIIGKWLVCSYTSSNNTCLLIVPENHILCLKKLSTMKNIFFFLLLATIATTAFAQNTQATDSITMHGFPVLRSYVAPDVIERAKKKFGRSLYCMETSKAANCENSFLVGLLRNGRLIMEWMCDDPKMVLHIDETTFIITTAAC